MSKSQESRDFKLAHELHQQQNCFGLTENAILPKNRNKENYKPRTLVDQTLELIDPTPNIYTLFIQFNERFFWNVLLPVEVKWSTRMTSCAGVCSFHPRNRQCVISLSAPLLKLRPRKDLVETLLHEMIHGFLFLTNNNRDRDGHGPEFCKHMDRINKAAGTKITIYHSFHDEVKLYQQHWWRCNGPCQGKAPYFGTVRRAMNRAPGPNDSWWKEHQQTCGGQFIKIKEPENFKAKGPRNKEKPKPATKNNSTNMINWLTKPTATMTSSTFSPISNNTKPFSNTQNSINNFKKLGTSTNNVHGWGTRGPNGLSGSPKTTSVTSTPKISSSGKLGNSSNNVHAWGASGPNGLNGSPKTTSVTSTPKISSSGKLGNSSNNVHAWGASGPNGLNASPKTTSIISTPKISSSGKLGNSSNNVHGWGTGGPNGLPKTNVPVSNTPRFFSSETLGGSSTGQSNLLRKFDNINKKHESNVHIKKPERKIDTFISPKAIKPLNAEIKLVECPVCSNCVPRHDINKHVDICLTTTSKETVPAVGSTASQAKADSPLPAQKRKIDTNIPASKQPKLDPSGDRKMASCPVCNKNMEVADINRHLDKCLLEGNNQNNNTVILVNDTHNESIISISSSSSGNSSLSSICEDVKDLASTSEPPKNNIIEVTLKCLVCNALIPSQTSLNDHLEDCIGKVFNDDSLANFDDKISELNSSMELDHANDKYPCPVCMQLISESVMNHHLDNCLKNS